MSKLLIIPSNTNIENTIEYTDGYLFGIRNMSVNMPCYIDLEELKKINKICLKNKTVKNKVWLLCFSQFS